MSITDIKHIVTEPEHTIRIRKMLEHKEYLLGNHKVMGRKDYQFKNESFISAKVLLQIVKTIIDFHTSYIVGEPISLIGNDEIVKEYGRILKKGEYDKFNYECIKELYSFGNYYEYVYKDSKGVIKSKLIRNTEAYPIYDIHSNYIMFIEYYREFATNIGTYIIYTDDFVETWSDEGGELQLVSRAANSTGLPIHVNSGWHDKDDIFGVSILDDIVPIIDEIEFLCSKYSDSINKLSLNPLGVSVADRIETESIDTGLVGHVFNVEMGGDFKWASVNLDEKSINLLLTTLFSQLYSISGVPSVIMGSSSVANVGETSLKLMFTLTNNVAKRTSWAFKQGLTKRFEYIRKLVDNQYSDDEFYSLDVKIKYDRPTDVSSMIEDLKIQKDMGAISTKTIMELSPYTETAIELNRLNEESGDSIVVAKSPEQEDSKGNNEIIE